jgi:carbon-monoxide dehydrogenase medium subunit
MKSSSFDYLRAREVPEALTALAQGGSDAKLLAGGQSLGPMLNLRLARPKLLIDVSRIAALKTIEEKPHSWSIGAAVTHAKMEDAKSTFHGAMMLGEVAAGIAYRGIRNRGTIGGSLAHADPAADWPLALATLAAVIHLRNAAGQTRLVPADDFATTAFTTRLAEDEMIESVSVPKISSAGRYGYFKFCRKTGEFAEASAAVVFDPEYRTARIFMGALSGAPRALHQLAEAIAQHGRSAVTSDTIATAVRHADPNLDSVDVHLHATVVRRAIERAMVS